MFLTSLKLDGFTYNSTLMISFSSAVEPANLKLFSHVFRASVVIIPGRPDITTVRPLLDDGRFALGPSPLKIPRSAASARPCFPRPLMDSPKGRFGVDGWARMIIPPTIRRFNAVTVERVCSGAVAVTHARPVG